MTTVAEPRATIRVASTLVGMVREFRGAFRVAADLRSAARLCADFVLFRVLRFVDLPGRDAPRNVSLRNGARITYRLNRGDIQTMREIWIENAYELPFAAHPKVLVDLGTNIGLASVWMSRRYGCTRVVAVEPSPANAALARANFEANGIRADLIEAAVGARDGTAHLEESNASNLNRMGATGLAVRMVGMPTVLARLPEGMRAELIKMDIEGAEEEVFDGEMEWLDRVDAIVLEVHLSGERADAMIARLATKGFRFLRSGAAFPGSMTAFVRHERA